MSVKKYHLTELHEENRFWVKELLFFKDEVAYFEKRLAEIAARNTSHDMLAKVEHFQNQFIRQKEVIDELKHLIKASENELENFARANNEIAIGHTLFADHVDLRDQVETFRQIYGEIKDKFRHFLAEWM